MRIGGRSFIDTNVGSMARLSDQIARLQGQIATGKRFSVASEAPVEAQKTALIARRQSDTQRFVTNLDQAEQRLTIADKSLDGMTGQLVRARELALSAASETSAPADRRIIAGEVREIIRVLVSQGNIQDASGNYVFSGALASTPAFAFDAVSGAVVYNGLGDADPIAVGDNAQLRSTEPAPALFGGVVGTDGTPQIFAILERFAAALEAPQPAADDTAGVAAQRAEFDAAIAASGAAIEHLSIARASFGGRLNRIESERDRLSAVSTGLATARSTLEDTDIAETYSNLSRASLILTATQRSFAQVSRLSLFDELR